MASNFLGTLFRITTFGESHGPFIGVVIDGCPANIELSSEEINQELKKRSPGKNVYVSLRKETDEAEIVSGVFEGKTTGAPIAILIQNKDVDSKPYEKLKDLYRPGHANFTYLHKYGIFDYRGGGRASARETACRVAAGAVAKKILKHFKINIIAYIKQIGKIKAKEQSLDEVQKNKEKSPIACPDLEASKQMEAYLISVKEEKDSIGGIVEFRADHLPIGVGDPVYEKIEANLAKAMMSLPAARGFEIGDGFSTVYKKGSESNDLYNLKDEKVTLASNHSGGVLGGITTGMPLVGRVCFKPTSSIQQEQQTVTLEGKKINFTLSKQARHDPCVAIRAVFVVEAMLAISLVDAILLDQASRLYDHDPIRKFQK